MKNYDFLSGLFLMVLSGVICTVSYRLGLGETHKPGPGFIPFGISGLLGLMSLYLCIKGLFQVIKGYKENEAFKELAWGKAMLVLGVLLGYGIVFNFIGFSISTFLLMLLLVGVVGRQKWRLTLAVSLLTVIFSYLIFVILLDLPFPRGPLGI